MPRKAKKSKIKPKTKITKIKVKTRKVSVKNLPTKDEYNKCMRCEQFFASKDALKKHLKQHVQAMHEIKLLEEGHVPSESKIGFEFKGKNRIIIS